MSYLFTIGLDKMKGAIPFMSSIDDVTDQINRNTMTRLMVMWAILRWAISTDLEILNNN